MKQSMGKTNLYLLVSTIVLAALILAAAVQSVIRVGQRNKLAKEVKSVLSLRKQDPKLFAKRMFELSTTAKKINNNQPILNLSFSTGKADYCGDLIYSNPYDVVDFFEYLYYEDIEEFHLDVQEAADRDRLAAAVYQNSIRLAAAAGCDW